MIKPLCSFCLENEDFVHEAIVLAPQHHVINGIPTFEYHPTCAGHFENWFDGENKDEYPAVYKIRS